MEAMERDAYTAAGWVNTKEECGKPVAKRERKNIWCMDAETSPAEAAPSARRPPQTPTAMQEALEKIRRGGDRKIIYVGQFIFHVLAYTNYKARCFVHGFMFESSGWLCKE